MKYQVCRDLTPIEYEALRNDIAENGVLVPIEIDENGDILDGHHRIKAWGELKAEGVKLPDYPRIIRAGLTEEQKRNHARKLNVLRRHMGKDEREQMMVDMRKDGMSVRKIAEATGVGKSTVQRVIESGVPFGTPDGMPKLVTGADGKQYPAKQKREPLPPNATTLVLAPPLATSILSPKPSGEVVRSETRFTMAPPIRDDEFDDMADDTEEDADGYDWQDEEVQRPPSRMMTTLLVTNDKQESDYLRTLQSAKDKAPDVFDDITTGKIKVTEAKREMRHREASESRPLPTDNKYRVVYADPPWQYGNSGVINDSDNYGRAERHYQTMSIDELCAMGDDIKQMTESNAVLFMWTTSPLLEESFDVIRAWGFQYKSSFVWDKVKHNFAHYNSMRHEFLLICTRGSCTPDVKQLFDSVQSIERTENHSEKPQEFRAIIDTIYTHGRRIELFARAKHDGWDTWGNEDDQDR